MPIAWLILMRNHTLSHMYFTWRMLIVFYIGIGVFFFKLFGEKEVMDKTEDIDKEGNDKSHIVEDNIKII